MEAVIEVESSFDPNAVSREGATGLMQLMRATANQYNVKDRFDPRENIYAGVKHLGYLLAKFNGQLPLVLAAYNAGDTAVRRWINRYGTDDIDEFIENIEYSETRTFVKEVLKNYYYYNRLYSVNSNKN